MPDEAERPPAASHPSSPRLEQALRINEEHLRALQRFTQQTAELHKQFLDSQERAFEGFRDLFGQHRRLIDETMGIVPVPIAPAAPVAPAR